MNGHILVVDDEPNLLEIYQDALTAEGYHVRAAAETQQALTLLKQESFDLVISDIVMPGLNGIELLRIARDRDPDLPVLLVTGSPTLETALQALEAGAVQYLVKPVSLEALVAAVARAVRLRRMSALRKEALGYLQAHERSQGEHQTLDASLTRALAVSFMAYQPILNAADGSVFGYESLLRTTELALPNPQAIFGAAERLGRVPEVGRHTRAEVAAWMSTVAGHGCVFVNIHPLDLADEDLLSADAPLSKHARNVVIEITERASLDDVVDVRSHVRRLRELGYRIAVDDLGAGYAGLASFATLEPEIVKLDIALIQDVHATPVKQKLIRSIASLCKDLGILVVAEGIESADDRDTVIELGCHLLQGYLFARPAAPPLPTPPDRSFWLTRRPA